VRRTTEAYIWLILVFSYSTANSIRRFKFDWSNSSEVGEQKHKHLAQTVACIISPKRPGDLTIQADFEGFHRITPVRKTSFFA